MALTKTIRTRAVPGASTMQSMDVLGDTAYPTGGYVLLPTDFNLTVLRRVVGAFFNNVAGAAYELAVIPTYNADGVTLAQINLALVVGTTGVQVTNGASVSTVGVTLIVEGN